MEHGFGLANQAGSPCRPGSQRSSAKWSMAARGRAVPLLLEVLEVVPVETPEYVKTLLQELELRYSQSA